MNTERTRLSKVSAGRYWVIDRATDFTMGGVFRRADGTWAVVLATTGSCHEGLPTLAAGQRLVERMVHVRKLPTPVDAPPNGDWLKGGRS